jgi:hypothetical protein
MVESGTLKNGGASDEEALPIKDHFKPCPA